MLTTGLERGEPLLELGEGEGVVFTLNRLSPNPRVRFLITESVWTFLFP